MLCTTFGVKWDELPLLEVLSGSDDSKLYHDVRLYEVETAMTMGIPFDHRWYTIEVQVREQMIASKLARISIDNLFALDSRSKR